MNYIIVKNASQGVWHRYFDINPQPGVYKATVRMTPSQVSNAIFVALMQQKHLRRT